MATQGMTKPLIPDYLTLVLSEEGIFYPDG